jgi:hypothetical protein
MRRRGAAQACSRNVQGRLEISRKTSGEGVASVENCSVEIGAAEICRPGCCSFKFCLQFCAQLVLQAGDKRVNLQQMELDKPHKSLLHYEL